MILLIAAVVGVVGLVWGVVAARNSFRNRAQLLVAPRLRAYPIAVAIGLVLAGASAFIRYPLNQDTVVFGLPFMSAILERHDGQLADFVGPLTVLAFIGNCAFFFLLPQIVLDAMIRRKLRLSLGRVV
jgi:hypothetical protein